MKRAWTGSKMRKRLKTLGPAAIRHLPKKLQILRLPIFQTRPSKNTEKQHAIAQNCPFHMEDWYQTWSDQWGALGIQVLWAINRNHVHPCIIMYMFMTCVCPIFDLLITLYRTFWQSLQEKPICQEASLVFPGKAGFKGWLVHDCLRSDLPLENLFGIMRCTWSKNLLASSPRECANIAPSAIWDDIGCFQTWMDLFPEN